MKKIKTVARKPRGRPPPIGKLVVFGVGLIGGSFALALKKRRAVAHVVGVGRSRANLLAARRLGIIDEIAADAGAAVKDADLVLLAVPLGQTRAVLAQIVPRLAAESRCRVVVLEALVSTAIQLNLGVQQNHRLFKGRRWPWERGRILL